MIKPDSGRPNDFLSLEDISAGQRFISRKYELTESDIKAFARQFDPQPFHLDNTAAQASVLRGLAASGWHTASITMRLWTESIPIAGGIVGVGGTVAWLARARPGDSLEVHAEIADVKRSTSNPRVGTIVVRSETRNQHDRVVLLQEVELFVPGRLARDAAASQPSLVSFLLSKRE